MFDLEVMNLSCDKIKPVGLEYCVLENLYYEKYQTTAEYKFLRNVYSDAEIDAAVEKPIIVHDAGAIVKMWKKSNRGGLLCLRQPLAIILTTIKRNA